MCHISVRDTRTDSSVAPMSGLSYELSHNFDPPPSWDHSPFSSPSSQNLAVERAFPDEASGAFWRPSDSPMTSAYPPSQFSVNSSSLSITQSSQSSREVYVPQRARDGRGWHPPPGPIRSMSLVNPEELPAHYQARYFQSPIAPDRPPAESGGHTSTHYAHTSHDTAASEPYSATGRHPLARQGQTGQPVGFNFPQWGAYTQHNTQMVEPGTEGFPHEWYSGSPHLAQVREESGSLHHHRPPLGPSPHQRNSG
jgi:hypothetical protein